jgi:hypothetical protein
VGEAYEAIPYTVWARYIGKTVRIDIARAESELSRAELLLSAEEGVLVADIPVDVRAHQRCPACGYELLQGKIVLREGNPLMAYVPPASLVPYSPPMLEMRFDGDTESFALPMTVDTTHKAWWCARCRTASITL